MSSTSSSRSRRGCGWLIVLLVVVAIGYSAIRYYFDQSNYTKGHQAYQQFDCTAAIPYFDSVVNSWRFFDVGGYAILAQQERVECLSFQVGADKQRTGDFGGSLLVYNDFVTNHSSSPLVKVARDRVESLFNQTEPSVLARQGICNQIDALLSNDLIPQRDTNLPTLYLACGQTSEDNRDYVSAIGIYEIFLSDYPDHPLTSDVKTALARSMVANAKARGAGEIPAPARSGSTSSGSTVVVIQNDSPERLRIVFSGPEARIEELRVCSSCQTYSGVGPLSCPEMGPIGRYTLKPGKYDVVVESNSGSNTTPWAGNWSLGSGDEYYSCFFIVTTIR